MSNGQSSDKDLVEELGRLRDEVRLKLHLASMEARDEWEKLEERWEQFRRKADLDETVDGIGESAEGLVDELRKGYERIRKAL